MLVFVVVIGGVRRICAMSEKLVPAMAVFYIGGAALVILLGVDRVPTAFATIIDGAFNGTAAAGGCAMATVVIVMSSL